MNWIRLQSEYFRHRKTLRLTHRLGELAALYPLRLWTWAVEQSPDGSLRDIDADELAVICGFGGQAGELWDAMLRCGFIEIASDDGAQIRSWREHQGKLIERAERNALRMRDSRIKPPAPEPTKPKPQPDEEPFPPILETPAFRAAWNDWLTYRRERRLGKWAPRTVKAKLAELAALGESAAIQSIRESIGNGWQGLFPPKSQASKAIADADRLRAGGSIDSAPRASIQSRLQRLADALPESLDNIAQRRAEIAGLHGDAESIEAELAKLDSRMIADLRDMASAETMAGIDAQIRAAYARVKGRIAGVTSAADFRYAMESTLIREHYGAPALTLFGRGAAE